VCGTSIYFAIAKDKTENCKYLHRARPRCWYPLKWLMFKTGSINAKIIINKNEIAIKIYCSLESFLNSKYFTVFFGLQRLYFTQFDAFNVYRVLKVTWYVDLILLLGAMSLQGNQEASKWTKWSNNNSDKWLCLLFDLSTYLALKWWLEMEQEDPQHHVAINFK